MDRPQAKTCRLIVNCCCRRANTNGELGEFATAIPFFVKLPWSLLPHDMCADDFMLM